MTSEEPIKPAGPTIAAEAIDEMMQACHAQIGQPPGTTSTFAHIYTATGFYLATGHSACVAPENFDAEVGTRLAMVDGLLKAKDILFQLEGYRLHCSLTEESSKAALN